MVIGGGMTSANFQREFIVPWWFAFSYHNSSLIYHSWGFCSWSIFNICVANKHFILEAIQAKASC